MKRECRLHGWWMVLRLQLGRPRRATSSVSVLGIHPRPGLDIITDAPEEEQEMRVFGWQMTVALPGKLSQQDQLPASWKWTVSNQLGHRMMVDELLYRLLRPPVRKIKILF